MMAAAEIAAAAGNIGEAPRYYQCFELGFAEPTWISAWPRGPRRVSQQDLAVFKGCSHRLDANFHQRLTRLPH